MKRTILTALLIAAALLCAACSLQPPAQETEQEPTAGQASASSVREEGREEAAQAPAPEEETAAPASATEAEETTAPEPAEEPTPAPAVPDAPVYDREGTNGTLPYVNDSLAAAAEINDDIDGRFGYLVDDEYCWLRYEWHTGLDGRVLSILIEATFEGDNRLYTPYNIDLTDGRQISGRELLGMLGVSENDLRDAELSLMGTEYESQFGSGREFVGEEVYNEQYEKTVAPENAEIDRVWIGDGGLLMFVAKIYSLAGADFYEYPMAAGYMFP